MAGATAPDSGATRSPENPGAPMPSHGPSVPKDAPQPFLRGTLAPGKPGAPMSSPSPGVDPGSKPTPGHSPTLPPTSRPLH